MTPLAAVPSLELADAPAGYQIPAVRPTLAEAKLWCRRLAKNHYENFHVATWFLPKRVRPHFESVYAYCRVSDDLGDEVGDAAVATRLLDEWGAMLNECYDAPQNSRHPVFVALHETIAACDLPRGLFHDLLTAFQMDQTKTRYGSMAELVEYSRNSANPVGRLVLFISGYREVPVALLSDKICTALQLANFWQDVVEDWERGRRYLPADLMQRFGVTDEDLTARHFTPGFRALMEHLVESTRTMLREGGEIVRHVDRELATTLDLFCKGGESILDAIAAQGYDTLKSRPEVSKTRKARLLAAALWGKIGGVRGLSTTTTEQQRATVIAAAYETCEAIAKREAKNFYYAFRVLPEHKRKSICAIYAFMRRADDIADDESFSIDERRAMMSKWLSLWRASTLEDSDPVFVAVCDTQNRFKISHQLLEQLVRGTAMDLQPAAVDPNGIQTFKTFEELYRYCYLVASIVGLVCIRIFGYSDSRAELLAEKTGIAFQLTNILRDVKEDAERRRVYLPLDRLHAVGLEPRDIVAMSDSGAAMLEADAAKADRLRSMVGGIVDDAKGFYAAAQELLPLIDADSRAALWVLVRIYSRLLSKIDEGKGDIFFRRAKVSRAEKIFILARGAAKALRYRVLA